MSEVAASASSDGASAAREVDVLVTGRSLPALLAALECAEVGLSVAVAAEPRDTVPDEVDTAERDPGGEIVALLERIAAPIGSAAAGRAADSTTAAVAGHPLSPRRIAPSPPRLLDRAGAWAPQPLPGLLGIPAVPLSREGIALLGWRGALRAYLDRLAPPLTIGKTKSFGALVRSRVGARVLAQLVEPQLRERYGLPATGVDAAVAAPGLNETLSRAGSLTAAVPTYAERSTEREAVVEPVGGWAALTAALLARLEHYGTILLDPVVLDDVVLSAREADDRDPADAEAPAWIAETADGRELFVRAMIVDHRRDPGERPLVPRLVAPPAGAPDEKAPKTLGARFARIHADINIREPDDAVEIGAGGSGVRSVGEWSVRIEGGGALDEVSDDVSDGAGAVWRATLNGPRVSVGSVEVDGDGGDGYRGGSGNIGDAGNGADPRDPGTACDGVLERAGLSAYPGAEWRLRVSAAPFATLEERDAARETLRAAAEQEPALLHVGRVLHGDDLGAALQHARAGAVHLRRRLLGLSA